jgi:hypothetical protein
MANAWYQKGLDAFARGEVDFLSAAIKVVAVEIGGGHYVKNLATDEFLSVIASGDRIGISAAVTGKTVGGGGILNGNPALISSPPAARTVGALVVIVDSGVPATSQLLLYIDSSPDLPLVTSGLDLQIAWDLIAAIANL